MQIALYKKLRLKHFFSSEKYDIESYLPEGKKYYCSSARNGLREILKVFKGQSVLLPAYVPQGIFLPFDKENYNIHFYDLNPDLTINWEPLKKRIIKENIQVFVGIYYFGNLQDMQPIKEFCKKQNVLFIEDCAHIFPCEKTKELNIGSLGDISFFSFNKFLPIPDGAVLCINNKKIDTPIKYHFSFSNAWAICLLTINMLLNTMIDDMHKPLRLKKWLIGFNKKVHEKYYHYVNVSEKPVKMSFISRYLLNRFDHTKHIYQYRANVAPILEKLRKQHIVVLVNDTPNMIYMALPLLVEKKDTLMSKLNRKGIRCTLLQTRWDYGVRGHSGLFPNAENFFNNHLLFPLSLFTTKLEAAYLFENIESLDSGENKIYQR